MTSRQIIKQFILKALLAADGQSLLERQIQFVVRMGIVPAPTDGDINVARKELESAGYIVGTDDDMIGRVWNLTSQGKNRASQLE